MPDPGQRHDVFDVVGLVCVRVDRIEATAYGERPGTVVRLACYRGEIEGCPTLSAEIGDLRYLSAADYLALPETAPAIVELLDRELIG